MLRYRGVTPSATHIHTHIYTRSTLNNISATTVDTHLDHCFRVVVQTRQRFCPRLPLLRRRSAHTYNIVNDVISANTAYSPLGLAGGASGARITFTHLKKNSLISLAHTPHHTITLLVSSFPTVGRWVSVVQDTSLHQSRTNK